MRTPRKGIALFAAARIICCMAGKRREDVREEDVTGLKYFDRLVPLLKRLHEVGCGRDKAGNRRLHFAQYCLLVLLFLFNPVVRSLRAIQQASQLRWEVVPCVVEIQNGGSSGPGGVARTAFHQERRNRHEKKVHETVVFARLPGRNGEGGKLRRPGQFR